MKDTRVWDTVIKIATALVWVCVAGLVAHEVRLSVIEASVYTQEDAIIQERVTTERFGLVEQHLGEMSGDIKVIRVILEERHGDE